MDEEKAQETLFKVELSERQWGLVVQSLRKWEVKLQLEEAYRNSTDPETPFSKWNLMRNLDVMSTEIENQLNEERKSRETTPNCGERVQGSFWCGIECGIE